jgi:putative tricarboxylic transport membrane protein
VAGNKRSGEEAVSVEHGPSRAPGIALLARQDFIGGLVVIAFAAFVYWQAADLPAGSAGGLGPGMLPKSLAVLLGALGALLSASAVGKAGVPLGRFTIRGPLFVIGAVVAFAFAIRPLGLVVAGPLAICIGALATNEVRPVETVVVGAVVTAFCIGLFKFALGLPIPLAPWLLGY